MTEKDKVDAKNGEAFLIESLWILDNDSGICLFEENYADFRKEGVSTDLISSFLSAILTFAGEAFTEAIQYIKFKNRKIVFEFTEQALFVIAVNEQSSDAITKRAINKIAERFSEKYGASFEGDGWRGGDVAIFRTFSEDLQEIVKRTPLKIKLIQVFDPLINLKKFENFLTKKLEKFDNLERKLRDKKFQRKASKKIKNILAEQKKLEKKQDNE